VTETREAVAATTRRFKGFVGGCRSLGSGEAPPAGARIDSAMKTASDTATSTVCLAAADTAPVFSDA
jgi:hypothetical protein